MIGMTPSTLGSSELVWQSRLVFRTCRHIRPNSRQRSKNELIFAPIKLLSDTSIGPYLGQLQNSAFAGAVTQPYVGRDFITLARDGRTEGNTKYNLIN